MIFWILGIAFVASVAIIIIGLWLSLETDHEFLAMFVSSIGMLGVIVALILFIVLGVKYVGATTKARLLNETYGTHYTIEDIVWGDDIIKNVIQGERKRIDATIHQK